MRKIFICSIILSFFLSSCKKQTSEKLAIDVSKVKEIKITNKVDCNFRNYKSGTIFINDKSEIKDIINMFEYLIPIKEDITTNVNNGYFEVDFNEGDINHYYTIIYTLYDGVIITNNNNGNMFKNNMLEVSVYKHFVKN